MDNLKVEGGGGIYDAVFFNSCSDRLLQIKDANKNYKYLIFQVQMKYPLTSVQQVLDKIKKA